MFFKKVNEIVVDVFVNNERIAHYPILPVARYLPQWFKDISSTKMVCENGSSIERPTFKRCDGMQNMLHKSFALPMWADLSINIDEHGVCSWVYPNSVYDFGLSNNNVQLFDDAFNPMVSVKIHSPYLLKAKDDIKFFCSQAVYSHNNIVGNLIIPPATVDYKYQTGTHINTILKKGEQYNFFAGQAMMYITPMTEQKVKFKTHVISTSEYKRIEDSSMPHKFIGSYKELKKITKIVNNNV